MFYEGGLIYVWQLYLDLFYGDGSCLIYNNNINYINNGYRIEHRFLENPISINYSKIIYVPFWYNTAIFSPRIFREKTLRSRLGELCEIHIYI